MLLRYPWKLLRTGSAHSDAYGRMALTKGLHKTSKPPRRLWKRLKTTGSHFDIHRCKTPMKGLLKSSKPPTHPWKRLRTGGAHCDTERCKVLMRGLLARKVGQSWAWGVKGGALLAREMRCSFSCRWMPGSREEHGQGFWEWSCKA
eukprot:1085482-Pelagomonas_calceolata.AAC.2